MCEWSRDSSALKQFSKIAFVIIFVIIVTMYNYVLIMGSFQRRDIRLYKKFKSNRYDIPPVGYLVWNDQCQMKDVNPLIPDVVRQTHSKNKMLCSDELPLTEVLYDLNLRSYMLHINDLAKKKLGIDNDNVSCCYQAILGAENGSVDNKYKLQDCVPFHQDYVLPSDVDSVITRCRSSKTNKEIQGNAHCLVSEKPKVRKRMQSFKRKPRPVSVLMLGIDGISRFNLRRTMPETSFRLLQGEWFELSGYNKIDDDAFPNLMALLTGYNMKTALARCTSRELDPNKCNYIWDLFRKNGYATSYAEDAAQLSAFNRIFHGFTKPPADYYLQPFMLTIENSLKTQKQNDVPFCIGHRYAAEYVYDYALQLATRYKSEPYFGLFLANTFSLNVFDDPYSMDMRIAKYLDEMNQRGILDDSIVIFFSNHCSIFGNVLDKCLPFIFIWLPPWLRARHPEFVTALRVNRYRLTNPYDIHMTLKHILELSNRTGLLPQGEDCPDCQSLLLPVSPHRSCKDIAIGDQWCTCTQYENIAAYNQKVVKAVRVILMNFNAYLGSLNFIPPCEFLRLKSIDRAQKKVKWKDLNASDVQTYRIRFTADAADAKFEVTVEESNGGKAYEIIGRVSRLDSNEEEFACIKLKKAKKFCICNSS